MAEYSTSMKTMGWLQGAGAFIEIMGILEQGKMARIQAERARVFREFNMQQAEKEAGATIAISQRAAAEERRQANMAASRALAVASASGAGVSDPTIVRLLSNIKGEGAYRASVALYEGEARARAIRIQGFDSGFDDSASVQAGYRMAAAARGMRTGLSLYAKYGMNGPNAGDTGRGDAAVIADNEFFP